MRDLHDGLGGQLVSIVALSERSAWEGDRIGDAARAALKDLRLVIDAMDDIDGDLMLALGAWRERTAAQLRPHGLPLEWHVLTPDGMPVHPELRPWHVIQILRLLDEAVTNAVKHAGAKRITRQHRDGRRHGRDAGAAASPSRTTGAALRCARPAARRAENGARPGQYAQARRALRRALEVTSGPGGTRVRLDLPRLFPEMEGGGGVRVCFFPSHGERAEGRMQGAARTVKVTSARHTTCGKVGRSFESSGRQTETLALNAGLRPTFSRGTGRRKRVNGGRRG